MLQADESKLFVVNERHLFSEEQLELIDRIEKYFRILIKDKTGVLPIMTLDSYKAALIQLCRDHFSPPVLNLAMDIMFRISEEREKHDQVGLALLEIHTYECLRLRPQAEEGRPQYPFE